MHFASGLGIFFIFSEIFRKRACVVMEDHNRLLPWAPLKRKEKNQPGMRIEMKRLLGCNEYFFVVNSEGAWNRCKNLSQSDISWMQTPES